MGELSILIIKWDESVIWSGSGGSAVLMSVFFVVIFVEMVCRDWLC